MSRRAEKYSYALVLSQKAMEGTLHLRFHLVPGPLEMMTGKLPYASQTTLGGS